MTDDDLVEILEEDEEDSELSESDAEEEEEEEAEGNTKKPLAGVKEEVEGLRLAPAGTALPSLPSLPSTTLPTMVRHLHSSPLTPPLAPQDSPFRFWGRGV